MTTAVTEDAPAASALPTFLPTDKHYRMTGEMPAETVEAPATSENEEKDIKPLESEGSAPSESETAAASETAPPQEPRQKTAATSENRWAKVTRENRELRERLARLEGAESARAAQRETQTSQPAKAEEKRGRPKPTDKNEKGEFLYQTLAELQEAQDKWVLDEAEKRATERFEKTAKERDLAQAKERVQKEITERVAKARKDHADYDTVAKNGLARKNEYGQDVIYIPDGSAVDGFILDSDRGHDVLYEVCKNPDKYAHIFAHDAQGKYVMSPLRQVRELAKIENSLDSKETAIPAKPITAAPRPPHQVSGKGTVAKDAIEQAVEDNDADAYMKEANARQLARMKKGK